VSDARRWPPTFNPASTLGPGATGARLEATWPAEGLGAGARSAPGGRHHAPRLVLAGFAWEVQGGSALTPAEIALLRSPCETEVISLMKDIALIVLGFLLGQVPGWIERRRRIRGHWGALAAEAEMCERLAGAYLADDVPAPLYRLPEAAFCASFPALLAEGVIIRLEARQLTEFRGAIQEINRGLDIASEARAANNNTLLQTEAGRLNTKCRNLLEGRGSTLPPSPFIRRMLQRHAGVASQPDRAMADGPTT
jgi:hypothetical protein